mmetsp:Transcript_39949/g.118947  ORF Transcript_39949/g.118947 Transcript_39949/m.118947 type:complete len:161 (+) Transcript_39949:243-725(+)
MWRVAAGAARPHRVNCVQDVGSPRAGSRCVGLAAQRVTNRGRRLPLCWTACGSPSVVQLWQPHMHRPGLLGCRSRARLNPPACAAAVAAATVTAQNVGAVGLKDAPLRSLFPDEPSPPAPGAPKLRVAIVGGGLAGLSTAVELLDQGWVTRLELGPTASP